MKVALNQYEIHRDAYTTLYIDAHEVEGKILEGVFGEVNVTIRTKGVGSKNIDIDEELKRLLAKYKHDDIALVYGTNAPDVMRLELGALGVAKKTKAIEKTETAEATAEN